MNLGSRRKSRTKRNTCKSIIICANLHIFWFESLNGGAWHTQPLIAAINQCLYTYILFTQSFTHSADRSGQIYATPAKISKYQKTNSYHPIPRPRGAWLCYNFQSNVAQIPKRRNSQPIKLLLVAPSIPLIS